MSRISLLYGISAIAALALGVVFYQARQLRAVRVDVHEEQARRIAAERRLEIVSAGRTENLGRDQPRADRAPGGGLLSAATAPEASLAAELGRAWEAGDPLALQRASLRLMHTNFLEARGLTPAQVERVIYLMTEKVAIKDDLLTAMREQQAVGSSAAAKDLARKVEEPVTDELLELLGGWDGVFAVQRNEQVFALRMLHVTRLQTEFQTAGMPLDPAQQTKLAEALQAYKERTRRQFPKPDEPMPWAELADDAAKFLSPGQVAVLRAQRGAVK